jgi:acetoin utilization protein AcuB
MKKPVITLSPGTPLPEAWDLIQERRFRHVPVVNKEGKLIGILSDRSILKEVAPFNKRKNHKFEEVTVEDIMSQPVLTAHPNTDINFIAKIFINERIGAMPVIDEDHKILGIITRSDILRTIVKVDLLEIRI